MTDDTPVQLVQIGQIAPVSGRSSRPRGLSALTDLSARTSRRALSGVDHAARRLPQSVKLKGNANGD